MSPTSPSQLALELAKTLKSGIRPTSVESLTGLLGLEIVRAKSATDSPDDLAVAATGIAKEAIRAVDGSENGAAAMLFGVATGTRGSLLKTRRMWAAGERAVSPEHFRKQTEVSLVAEVADEIFSMDSVFRLRAARKLMGENKPTDSSLAINWLERHEAYGRLWTPIYALGTDLQAAREARKSGEAEALRKKYVESSLWWNARFLLGLRRFTEAFGGLWLFTDPDDEVAVMDAVYRINFHTDLSEHEDSMIRVRLSEIPGEELQPFVDRLKQTADGKAVVAKWDGWVDSCACDGDTPQSNCTVHLAIGGCETYTRIVDEDWYRLADWYRDPTTNIHGEDVKELWKRHDPFKPT